MIITGSLERLVNGSSFLFPELNEDENANVFVIIIIAIDGIVGLSFPNYSKNAIMSKKKT
jgi:hypothetical protein